ncbi:multidrug efflux SMR transporter [Streptomyces sp. SID3212]|uniref:DMT family transporter n=1 Tax=unclassified Streptomyces TaxID=2593676 RepID=UPI00136AC647|nr:multidrug efflux SMR transporter [Streptomyces sp. SID3212]MYV53643.1 QacE family quaternary ammonium compound efflux SMR transporter [Streptomyces sp. SID3212]
MAWAILTVAGLLEVVWALALKESGGFTKLWPSTIGITFAALSFVLLTFALRDVPVGTGYAVWVGIGAAGVVVAGIVQGEAASAARVACILAIIGGVVGLRLLES